MINEKELWIPVVGFEANYSVSTFGRIYSQARPSTRGGFMIPQMNRLGYHKVILSKDGIKYSKTIHRVVLESFDGPCPAGMESCHGNGRRTDNRLDNLRWDTPVENHSDKRKHGTQCVGETQGRSKLTNGCVERIRDMLALGESSAAIARWFDVSNGAISHIKLRRSWRHVRAA